MHLKIYEYCNTELITEIIFIQVFEAVKSIAERNKKVNRINFRWFRID